MAGADQGALPLGTTPYVTIFTGYVVPHPHSQFWALKHLKQANLIAKSDPGSYKTSYSSWLILLGKYIHKETLTQKTQVTFKYPN